MEVFAMLPELIAYLIIPTYTIFFAADSNWFTSNFSVLGNQTGWEMCFTLWGLLVGTYFFWCLRKIVHSMPKSPRGTWLIHTALLLLTFAITTPYLPNTLPRQAFLHVIFAFFSSVCLILVLFLILWKLRQKDSQTYLPFLFGLAAITCISLFLILLVGIISSALEIFFTITVSILVCRLYRRTVG